MNGKYSPVLDAVRMYVDVSGSVLLFIGFGEIYSPVTPAKLIQCYSMFPKWVSCHPKILSL